MNDQDRRGMPSGKLGMLPRRRDLVRPPGREAEKFQGEKISRSGVGGLDYKDVRRAKTHISISTNLLAFA